MKSISSKKDQRRKPSYSPLSIQHSSLTSYKSISIHGDFYIFLVKVV